MRIIGGKYRGRQLRAPGKLPVRPTTDQAKEGLFNILAHRFTLDGADVLDLFAGTGNVSYEFLSRGAASVTAVDRHAGCVRYIRGVFEALGATEGRTVKMPAERFLRTADGAFDIVFMDPPYDMPGQEALVMTVFERGLLRPGGLLILEHVSADSYDHLPNFLEMRKYGGSSFSMFQTPVDP